MFVAKLSMCRHSSFVWTPRNTLTSPSSRPSEVAVQDEWRDATWRRPREEKHQEMTSDLLLFHHKSLLLLSSVFLFVLLPWRHERNICEKYFFRVAILYVYILLRTSKWIILFWRKIYKNSCGDCHPEHMMIRQDLCVQNVYSFSNGHMCSIMWKASPLISVLASFK